MIVPSHTVTLIQQGKVTCLILPEDETRQYLLGASYSVQSWKPREGGGAPVVSGEKLRVRVTAKLWFQLRDVPLDAAVAAGFESVDELHGHWRDRYSTGPLIDTPVRVVAFEIDRLERERYLRPGGGYTSSPGMALRTAPGGEPVAPDLEVERAVPAGAQREQTKRARVVWAETASMRRSIRERDQRRREQGVRLEDAKRKLRLQGKDFSSKERAAERVIRDLERLADENGNQEAA